MQKSRRPVSALALVTSLATTCASVYASDSAQSTLEVTASPYTLHYHYDSKHKPVVLLGLTDVREDGRIISGAVFSNSFGQPCVTLLYGQRYQNLFGRDDMYWEWAAGPMYGYVGEYKNKVPLNYNGLSPAFVPSIGYQINDRWASRLSFLGANALMFQFSYALPQ
jgi:hypothetical protein